MRFFRHGKLSKLYACLTNILRREANWWQNLTSELQPAPSDPSIQVSLLPAQAARIRFYIAVLKFGRMIGGEVIVAVPAGSNEPAAVLLWLPPKVRPTLWSLLWSGWFRAWFAYGLVGMYRLWYYENTLASLYARTLAPLGYRQTDGAFVQIIATAPGHAGKAYSTSLLEWQIEQHKERSQGIPVFLDTATDYGQAIYERIGFRELGRTKVLTNRDDFGLPFQDDITVQQRNLASQRQYQRVMILECLSSLEKDRGPGRNTVG